MHPLLRRHVTAVLWAACFPLTAAELPALRHATVVIAHRGEHRLHHENTLESIDGAVEAGADYTEMDVRRSKDGQHLLMHDSTVDRMTDGTGRVADLTWDELSRRVVRSRHLTNVSPSRIPRLGEALDRCRGRICIYLDFKDGDRREVTAQIRAAGMMEQVLIYDRPDAIAAWRLAAPELPVITSPPERAKHDRQQLREFLGRIRPEVLDQAPDAGFVELIHSAGVRAWPDVQSGREGPEYWDRIWKRGVRGFQTDHPAELVRWLKRQGRR